MIGELVSVLTEDKVRLDGFYREANRQSNTDIDSAILIHGLSGNFYKSRLLKHFATELNGIGISTVLVNTRGHDYLNSTPRMGRSTTLGAAVELIDECKHDLYAWCEFLDSRERSRVLLLGHSLGAIKSLYAQAHLPHENVKKIAAFSATKLSYDSLVGSSGGERFAFWLNAAQAKVAEGKGDDFLFVDFPFPTWMSATAYLAKYGDGDKNNWLNFKEQISIPVLAAFGEREMEDNAAFNAMKADLANIRQANFTIDFVPNADHFYSACFDEASNRLMAWLGAKSS